MSVKRYECVACDEHACHCDVVESAQGDMVDYEDYAALERRLIESERYGRQTDITIDNLEMKLAQMAAENADLKHSMAVIMEHVSVTDAGQAGVVAMIINDALHNSETPVTATFLAELRASVVDGAIEELNQLAERNDKEAPIAADHYRSAALYLKLFADQPRKGVQS
ncbi:hypothetical protein UXQ08_12315 [Enterobacter ludwigii]|uniref:hypothetical protein n=1 Tax=Enterobacter ludwigii TaxID=299767 RepID=UPI002FD144C6